MTVPQRRDTWILSGGGDANRPGSEGLAFLDNLILIRLRVKARERESLARAMPSVYGLTDGKFFLKLT